MPMYRVAILAAVNAALPDGYSATHTPRSQDYDEEITISCNGMKVYCLQISGRFFYFSSYFYDFEELAGSVGLGTYTSILDAVTALANAIALEVEA